MAASPIRYKRLIQELPKHKSATDAIKAAGFTDYTAEKQQKRVLQSALKYQAREILNPDKQIQGKSRQLMSEIVGMSGEQLFERLRYIATQEKDLASALKVIAPLVKEMGVDLKPEEGAERVTVPVLNIVVNKKENDES